jgi:hypothetical protein
MAAFGGNAAVEDKKFDLYWEYWNKNMYTLLKYKPMPIPWKMTQCGYWSQNKTTRLGPAAKENRKPGNWILDAFNQLDLVAEIAAALLGFIAIFLALSKTNGRFTESDRHFIQALVLSSSLAVILAIAPRSISLFVADDSVWYVATILAFVLGSLSMTIQIRQQLQMSREEATQIHWTWHFVAWGLGIAGAALFVLALLDNTRTTAFYVGGVTMLIPLCLWVFIGVVFRRFF